MFPSSFKPIENKARNGNNNRSRNVTEPPGRAPQKVPTELQKLKREYENISRQNNKTSTNNNVIEKLIRELKKYGFEIDGRIKKTHNSILGKLKEQLPNAMKPMAKNVNTISGIIKLMEERGNSNSKNFLTELPITWRQKNFNKKIKEMNRNQLFKLLLDEFPDISKSFVNDYNDKSVSDRMKLYNYTLRKLKIYYKGYLELLGKKNNVNSLIATGKLESVVPFNIEESRRHIRTLNKEMNGETILKKFFYKLSEYSSLFLKDKKWYGYPPLATTMMRVRQKLQGKNKINKRPLSQRGLNTPTAKGRIVSKMTYNYNTNSNNTNSKTANNIIKQFNSEIYNKLTKPLNNRLKSDAIITANITMDTFIVLNILLWMDQKHDFGSLINDNFFNLLINNTSTFYTLFPKYKNNRGTIIESTKRVLREKSNHILKTLFDLKLLEYNESVPSLKIVKVSNNNRMETTIKNNFKSFLPENNARKIFVLNAYNRSNVINKLIQYVSIDSESERKTVFKSIQPHKRYIPLERVLDPGYGFSDNKSIVNFIKSLTSKNKLPVTDFQIRKYKIKVNNNVNAIEIGYNNNVGERFQYKPSLKVNNLKINIGLSMAKANKAARGLNGSIKNAKPLWSKTFGDFMQILAIASRGASKKQVHYGTFDTMSALLYLFVRKYVYGHNNIYLALQKSTTHLLIIN